jgi:CBS domain-containing protein
MILYRAGALDPMSARLCGATVGTGPEEVVVQSLTVGGVMTKDVHTVRSDTAFKFIVELLALHQISAVPVVADDGQAIGLVSETDLLRRQENDEVEERHSAFTGREARRRMHKAVALTAADLMTTPVYSVTPGESLSSAARELARRGVRRLLVVDEGKLVGVVSRRDLLSVFRRSDEDIQREVLHDVLMRTLWAAPEAVGVRVEEGVVTMVGRLERKCEVEIAGRLVAKMPGVVEVHNRLDYVWNDMPERRHA